MDNNFAFFDLQAKEQIKKLKEEVDAIQKEITPKLQKIEESRRKIEYLEKYLTVSNGLKFPPGETTKAKSSATLSDLAISKLKEIGEPVHYTILMDKIEKEEGLKIPGRDPKANMTAHLSNDSRMARFGRGIYGLKEWKESTRN